MFKKCSKISLMYPTRFQFTNFWIIPRIDANPHLLCTILEMGMMSILPTFVKKKKVRIQALSD